MITIRGLIRWILTLALAFGAYSETGVCTATSLVLIFIAIEFHIYFITESCKEIKRLADSSVKSK